MPELEAYRRSQRPCRHDWRQLRQADDGLALDWCPPCGEVRRREDAPAT